MQPDPQVPAVPPVPSDLAWPRRRDLAVFTTLMIVTLGFYFFYVAYQWAREVNGLEGRVKYRPDIVLVVTILTCNVFGLVFETLFAFDVAEHMRARGVPGRIEQLPIWIVVCNVVAIGLCLMPFGCFAGFPLGVLASVLVQAELNRLADLAPVVGGSAAISPAAPAP